MKKLFIILALLSATALASDSIKKENKSVSEMLEAYKEQTAQAPISREVQLENEVRQLQTELRETRRKYYAAKTKLKKLEQPAETTGYTKEQVETLLIQAQNEVYYDGLKYSVAEREFVLTLTSIEDVHWIASKVLDNDLARIESLKGDDKLYEAEILEIIEEYKTYYNANRQPQQHPVTEQQQVQQQN